VRDLFPDGALWVDLGQHPGDEQLVAVLADLTVRLTGEARPAYETVLMAADAFATALGERRLLLVVDDVWRLRDVEPLLRGGPRCVRLVTTRRSAVVTGHEIGIDAMSASEATALLRAGLAELPAAGLGPLLERSGRWPLALVLLGAVLRSVTRRRGLSTADAVDVLVAELDRRGIGVLDDLTDPGGGRTIEATLTMSLDELEISSPATFGRYVSLAAFDAAEQVPIRLLERLWGLNEIEVWAEFDRLSDRSLVVAADAGGIRLHDLIRDQLRRRFPERVTESSQALLEVSRPAGGWHALADGDELWPRLASHLLQATRGAELRELLRDMRFLVARLGQGGPLAVESDLRRYRAVCPQDTYAAALAMVFHQEAHLIAVQPNATELAVTLHSRLASRPDVAAELGHVQEPLPAHSLIPLHPLPDRADPRLARVLTGHRSGGINSLAWTPAGMLASVGHDSTLRLWDITTGEQKSIVDGLPHYVSDSALSPDGRYLAVAGRDRTARRGQEEIRVVDVVTGTVVAERPGPSTVCWGSSTLAIGGLQGVELWNPFDGTATRILDADRDGVQTVGEMAWHPRAGLVRATLGGSLIRWPCPTDAGPGWEVWDLGLSGRCELAWRPDGRQLSITAGSEFLIVEPARRHVVQRTPTYSAYAHAWRPDGAAIALSEGDKETREWHVALWHRTPGAEQPAFVPGGRLPTHVARIAWHPGGEFVATSSAEPDIQLWRPAAPAEPVAKAGSLMTVAWQPEGDRLVVRNERGVAGFMHSAGPGAVTWTTNTKDRYSRLPDAVWSPDGRSLIEGGDGRMKIRGDATGDVIRELRLEPGAGGNHVDVIAWPLPRLVITESGGIVAQVDPETGSRLANVRIDHAHDLRAVSADGARIAVVLNHRHISVVVMGSSTSTTLDWAAINLRDVAFLPGTARLLTSDHGGLSLWEVAERRVAAKVPWKEPTHMSVDPTGTYVGAVRVSGEIALFHARTLERLCQLTVDGTLQSCAFDDTGMRFAVAGSNGLYLFRIRR
jgi:WD40 repeat protein